MPKNEKNDSLTSLTVKFQVALSLFVDTIFICFFMLLAWSISRLEDILTLDSIDEWALNVIKIVSLTTTVLPFIGYAILDMVKICRRIIAAMQEDNGQNKSQ